MMKLQSQLQEVSRAWWVGYLVALASVALVSVVIGVALRGTHFANISMLYLIAVLAIATLFGSGPAIFASLIAFLTFDWFFVEPLHTFTVANTEEWIALLLFLLTAFITGQLAAGQRRRAQEAQQREREAVVLYDIVRLIGDPDLERALGDVAERLRRELRLDAVAIEVSAGADGVARATAGEPGALHVIRSFAKTSSHLLMEGAPPSSEQRGGLGPWVRIVPPHPPGTKDRVGTDRLRLVPVRAQDRRVGDLFLVRPAGSPKFREADDRLLAAVAAQLGLAVERVRLRREATEAEILRRTDQLKTALLNAVSHDLRTPLASIIASAGSLRQLDVAWTEEDRQQFAEAIEEEAQRLNQIVGNLLDLSRIEGGSLRPEKGWYDIGALIDDVLGRLRPLISEHHVEVSVVEDLPPVLLDYVEVDQVLSNLIENAAKYAPPDTEISISVRRVGKVLQTEVADRGPGIPPSALPHLFEPFYRIPEPGVRVKGTGLGLAVAKGLVEAHDGRIWAENRRGGGTRFVFTLPLTESTEAGIAPEEPSL